MGLYDTVRFEDSKILTSLGFPEDQISRCEFQTKDLSCDLTTYLISKDGRLMKESVSFESVPENQRPFYGKPEWDDPVLSNFYRSIGSFQSKHLGWIPSGFSGQVQICTCYAETGQKYFWDLLLEFREGRLIKTKVLSKEKIIAGGKNVP